jgi:hypothetical protein|tara:strand:+ start:73 stop:255 length:183 start_codon:yes stop_codon:yes gene_type:complete
MKGMSKGIGPLKLGVPKTMAKMGHPDAAMKKMHSPMDMYDTPAKNVGPKDAYIGPGKGKM